MRKKAVQDLQSTGRRFDQPVLAEYIRRPEVKRLLNQILSAQDDIGFKSLIVLSEKAGEGRSLFTSALALSYATLLNRSVLVVDAISQAGRCSLGIECALNNRRGGSDEPRARIDVLTLREEQSGPSESTEFQIGSCIAGLQKDYDLVIFDSCALSNQDPDKLDPVIMSKYADVAVLITSRATLSRDELRRVRRELSRLHVHHKLLGMVYNSGVR